MEYRTGMIFENSYTLDWYILAQVAPETYTLVSLKDGNRFKDPICTKEKANKLTEHTVELVSAPDTEDTWRLVSDEEARGR